MDNTVVVKAFKRVRKEKEQYFKPSENYDKKVYENTFGNIVGIIFVLCLFYFFNGLVTWGMFEFGIAYARAFTWWSLAIFGFGLITLIIMLASGEQANRKKRAADYLKARISEKHATELEEQERENEDKKYKAKLEKATRSGNLKVEDVKVEMKYND